MITVYGIRSCDSCRRALKWLGEQQIEHQFHDVREDGLDDTMLRRFQSAAQSSGATTENDPLLNRRSTTWRQLADDERAHLDAAGIRSLILLHPALMKRPVIDTGHRLIVGFDTTSRDRILADSP